LHHVSEDLDAGDVIGRTRVRIEPGLHLHQLRARSTSACLDLILAALDAFQRSGRFTRCPQRNRGRYYSFMPAVLKPTCVRRFERYTRELTA
jgi:methionyl-tRNA formyltransferase